MINGKYFCVLGCLLDFQLDMERSFAVTGGSVAASSASNPNPISTSQGQNASEAAVPPVVVRIF